MDTRSTAVLSGLHGTFAANVAEQLTVDGHWGVPLDAHRGHRQPDRDRPDRGWVHRRVAHPPPPVPATSTLDFQVSDNRANGLGRAARRRCLGKS